MVDKLHYIIMNKMVIQMDLLMVEERKREKEGERGTN